MSQNKPKSVHKRAKKQVKSQNNQYFLDSYNVEISLKIIREKIKLKTQILNDHFAANRKKNFKIPIHILRVKVF